MEKRVNCLGQKSEVDITFATQKELSVCLYRGSFLLECSCFIEFINQVEEKR